jgi:hypothetical protein
LKSDRRDPQAKESPARFVLAFGGERTLTSARANRSSKPGQLLTREQLPYPILACVWSADEPLETFTYNPRTGQICKLVLETEHQSLKQRLPYERDVRKKPSLARPENSGPRSRWR